MKSKIPTISTIKESISSGRARHHHRVEHSSAIDEPLPVASVLDGTWRSRRKLHRTPRRLATLRPELPTDTSEVDASGTTMCIAGDEYIVVANTVSTPVLIYRLTHSAAAATVVTPWNSVSLIGGDDDNATPSSSAIVSLMALPFGKSLIYGEPCRKDEGHIVAFSDDGQGFILRIRRDDGATKICSFPTQNFGVTCAAVVPVAATGGDHHLLVGYQTGYIESWKIFRFSPKKILAKLLWRGIYPHSYSIQNMAPLTVESHNNNTQSHRYLLVTVQSPSVILKTSAMVEVMDIQSLPEDWKQRRGEQQGHYLRAVKLDSRCWVMPGARMELLNTSTLGSHHTAAEDDENLPRRAHVIPSASTGSICDLPQASCVALADGTIAMLTATEDTKEDELRWGVANDYNQLLLPYPAIGCAAVNWDASQHPPNYSPHVACCLRGGSTYLMPFVNPEDANSEIPVTVFLLDVETHSRYIHGFTAGNLILSPPPTIASEDQEHNNSLTSKDGFSVTTPVLVYGWAGGIVDVFSCELNAGAVPGRRPMITHREESALEDLISNGSYNLLADLMMLLLQDENSTDSNLLQQPIWKNASLEFQKHKGEATVADLLTPEYAATRQLLLHLSTNLQEASS
ncbi:expressed unknown protein [Seminavis robusta]|uniref:Uncharacterized protein n=1 Tax=Seminavis robusta TaxID=568900 RepID=A0A9N8ELC3_9STRA|nr:expressed unknown protein [Seminavis robusta]|eukprot:Sro1406_g269880.1 n/a (628) ;mRNA; r:9739-11859